LNRLAVFGIRAWATQQYCVVHGAKPGKIFRGWPNPDRAQSSPGSVAEHLRKGSNRPRAIAPGGKMPESLTGPRIKSTLRCLRDKTRNASLVSGSKEEGLVKFTAARTLGISRPKPGVFRDLLGTHMVEPRYPNATLPGNVIQRCADLLVRTPQGHAEVASGPLGVRDLDVEITIRVKNPAAALCDKRVSMSQLSAEGLYFIACARRYQHQRNVAPIQFRQRFLGRGKRSRARVQQGGLKGREN
jgi:hypothetical protein